MRRRLDAELVRRGMAESRTRAAAAIEERNVLVSGAVAEKPSRLVGAGEPIEMRRRPRFVSRGGEKLDHGLAAFSIEVSGRRCIDAGASTGGFTDCLLQRGARSVVALDVGRGQLDARLRADPRVSVLEGVNARDLAGVELDGGFGLVTADVSFISVLLVLPALAAVAADDADYVILVKPQFEAGRAHVERGGVVRSAEVHQRVLERVVERALGCGLAARGLEPSPLRGPAGNIEFLAHLRPGPTSALGDGDVSRVVDRAHQAGAT